MEKPTTKADPDILLWNISINDDKHAFHLLFEDYYVPLCLYAKRYVVDKTLREDIVQDVFFTIWEKRKSIEVNTSAKSYLIACVKNNCLNQLRKQGYYHEYQDKIRKETDFYPQNDTMYNLQELEELLNKTLEKLPEEYRLAFIMSRMEEKTTEEIANIMGVSVRTVERYRKQATEILKNELKDFLPISIILFLIS